MTDAQIERLMLAHYQLWLAFTTEHVRSSERYLYKYKACMAFAIDRAKRAHG